MRTFDGGEDALLSRDQLIRRQRRIVFTRGVAHAARVLPVAVLGADAGVVETGGDRVDIQRLTIVILQHVAVAAVQDAFHSVGERAGVVAGVWAAASRFDPGEGHGAVLDERVEDPRRVRAAADAGDHLVWQSPQLVEALLPTLLADHRLEVADDHRERVRPHDRTQDVVRVLDAAHPVPHRLVDRIPQRPRPARHRSHLRPHHPHDEHVQLLPPDILLAHVDHAREAEPGTRCGGRDAMLARSGFGDDAGLAHPLGEQHLPQRVVDLVRPGEVQILPLEVDLRPSRVRGQAFREVQRAGPPDIVLVEVRQLPLKLRVRLGPFVLGRQLLERVHERLGNEPATELPKATLGIRNILRGSGHEAGLVLHQSGERGGVSPPSSVSETGLLPVRASASNGCPDFGTDVQSIKPSNHGNIIAWKCHPFDFPAEFVERRGFGRAIATQVKVHRGGVRCCRWRSRSCRSGPSANHATPLKAESAHRRSCLLDTILRRVFRFRLAEGWRRVELASHAGDIPPTILEVV